MTVVDAPDSPIPLTPWTKVFSISYDFLEIYTNNKLSFSSPVKIFGKTVAVYFICGQKEKRKWRRHDILDSQQIVRNQSNFYSIIKQD